MLTFTEPAQSHVNRIFTLQFSKPKAYRFVRYGLVPLIFQHILGVHLIPAFFKCYFVMQLTFMSVTTDLKLVIKIEDASQMYVIWKMEPYYLLLQTERV